LQDSNHYGEWIKTLRSNLAKVQQSSVQLLEAVDNLEVRQETDRVQLLREVAKLEFNVTKTSEQQKDEYKIYKDSIDEEQSLSSDIRHVKEDVLSFEKELMEKDARISDTNYRLESLAGTVFEFMKDVNKKLGIDDAVYSPVKTSKEHHNRRHIRKSHKKHQDNLHQT